MTDVEVQGGGVGGCNLGGSNTSKRHRRLTVWPEFININTYTTSKTVAQDDASSPDARQVPRPSHTLKAGPCIGSEPETRIGLWRIGTSRIGSSGYLVEKGEVRGHCCI
jgi:hypothetical protein